MKNLATDPRTLAMIDMLAANTDAGSQPWRIGTYVAAALDHACLVRQAS